MTFPDNIKQHFDPLGRAITGTPKHWGLTIRWMSTAMKAHPATGAAYGLRRLYNLMKAAQNNAIGLFVYQFRNDYNVWTAEENLKANDIFGKVKM